MPALVWWEALVRAVIDRQQSNAEAREIVRCYGQGHASTYGRRARGASPSGLRKWRKTGRSGIVKAMQQSIPIAQDLVLVGGGHAHVHVLKRFGMQPVPGVRLTLITRDGETPYSGMLPGYVAGLYSFDECHIDLMRLARFAGARLIHDEATGLDRAERRGVLRAPPPLPHHLLSPRIRSPPPPPRGVR